MKQTLSFFITFLAFLNCTAQHAVFAAGEITYEHISDSTYRFYANLYLDCAGGKEPDSVIACFNNPCDNSFSFTAKLIKTNNRGNVAQMGCSQYPTNCSEPGAIRGYRIWHYGATITFPAQCNSWRIAVMADTMTSNLALTPAKFFVETTFNNMGVNRDNSSPFFIDDAVAYCGELVPFNFRTQPIDSDGDSLVIEVVTPRTADSLCGNSYSIQYMRATPPYSVIDNPFPTASTFQFDKNTLSISFYPAAPGTGIMALKVHEYRKGRLLGTVIRNQIIHIMQGPIIVIPLLGNILNLGNLQNCENYYSNIIRAHVNYPFKFQMYSSSTANDAKLVMRDNGNSVLPGASITYNHQYSKTVFCDFSYTPNISDTGTHNILVTVVDTTCRPPGFSYGAQGTLQIVVDALFPSQINSVKDSVNFQIYPNPNNGHFKLKGYEPGMGKIAVVNTMGQIVDVDVKITDSEMNLSDDLPAGIYALKIYKNGSTQTLPFVINR